MQRNVLKGFLTHHTKVRLIAVAIILLFDARGTLARAAEAEKLNVFYSSIAASSVVTWIPKEAGIYKKYGLDVNLIYAVGSQAITTLISGDIQIGQGSGAVVSCRGYRDRT
jgi:ABC-type nitrate/sulfonate/bicarbonate transport system substrate-binding protein